MARIKKEYGDARRTQLIETEAQIFTPEDLIAEEDVVVTITRDGYIKKLPKDTYRMQGRGGKGIIGLTKKEEDSVEHLFVCTTHHILLIFTNRGQGLSNQSLRSAVSKSHFAWHADCEFAANRTRRTRHGGAQH